MDSSNKKFENFRQKSLSTNSSSNSPATSGPILLPWDRFSYWVHSILVVTFDIEMGQSLESIYPSANHVKLSANDKSNICYMSFPDSNSGVLGDTQYHFRFKHDVLQFNTNNTVASSLNSLALTSLNSNVNKINYDDYNRRALTGLEVERSYMFGYVFFRQVKDKTLKRGYFQKVDYFFLKSFLFSLIINLSYFGNSQVCCFVIQISFCFFF